MRFETILASAELGGIPCGELVAGGEKDLGSKTLEQRPPALLARKSGPERADALRGDNWDQPRLARQRKRTLIAGRIHFAHRRERVVLVADEQQVSPDALRMCRDLRDALKHGALEIEFQHDAE